MLNTYIAGIFAPQLIDAFGWTRSQFALVGMATLMALIGMPIAGRLADLWGAKRVATVGVILGPIIYFSLSQMNGNFYMFMMLCVMQTLFVGPATTTAVYSRLIAENFKMARGTALAIAASVPAAVGAAAIPVLAYMIHEYDWRAAYQVVALSVAIGGLLAILLMPPPPNSHGTDNLHSAKPMKYSSIIRNPAFKLLLLGMFLCNLTLSAQATQIKLIFLEKGTAVYYANLALSLYAVGVIVGRLFCGFTLDRFPSHYVATVGLGLPGIGLLILALAPADPALLIFGVVLLGMAMGAELDIAGFLVMKYFNINIYSSAYSLIAIGTAMSAAAGSAILSMILSQYDSFVPFLLMTGIITIIGSLFFFKLGKLNPEECRNIS